MGDGLFVSLREGHVNLKFHPIGSAPRLKSSSYDVRSDTAFKHIVSYLKQSLETSEDVFAYINNQWEPLEDQIIGDIVRCFSRNDTLAVHYSVGVRAYL